MLYYHFHILLSITINRISILTSFVRLIYNINTFMFFSVIYIFLNTRNLFLTPLLLEVGRYINSLSGTNIITSHIICTLRLCTEVRIVTSGNYTTVGTRNLAPAARFIMTRLIAVRADNRYVITISIVIFIIIVSIHSSLIAMRINLVYVYLLN